MTNLVAAVGKRIGKKGELGNKLDEVLTQLMAQAEDGILINAAGLAKQAGVKNKIMACVSALKRAVKAYPGSEIQEQGYSNFTVKLVKPVK